MNQLTPEQQTLIEGFLRESSPEEKRISLLDELSKIDEEVAIDLISKTFQKKPTVSFAKSMGSLLPKMHSIKAYELVQKYVLYLLKYDIERLPKHTEHLAAALPILNEFHKPESTEIIMSAYSRFRNERQEQKAVVNSGVFQELLKGDITEQQRIETLFILGRYEELAKEPKGDSFDAACRKIVKMHSDLKQVEHDLEFIKERGDMELYKSVLDKVKSKLMPGELRKAGLIAGSIVLVAFVIFVFFFVIGKDLSRNQIFNKLTGFGISAFCTFVIAGTIVLFRFKNR